MTSIAAPTADTINNVPAAADVTPSTFPPASAAPVSASSSSSSLSFDSLLSPSTAALGGTIGSTSRPEHISPMAPVSSSAASSASHSDSSAAAALPFDLRALVESVKQRQLQRRIRPAAAFFDPNRFSRPQSATEATTRVELNLQWFWINYLLIAALILVLTVLSQPSLLVTLLVLAAVWLVALTRDVITIPYTPYSLVGATKLRTMYVLTAVTLFVFAGTTILVLVAVCGLVVVAHATLHATPTQEERDGDEQLDSITMTAMV